MEISLVTVIWSMIASACLTLAGIQLLVWCKTHNAWPNLLFSLTAVSTAAFAFCELRMMRASTPAEFGSTLKWGQVPVWLLVVSLVGFVRVLLKAGRPSLAWTVCGLRTFALLLDFSVGQNLNYREITRLRQIPFLGESIQIAEGVPNPWMLVGQLSLVMLLIFVADASVTAWRRGDRQKPITVGGSIVFFTLVSTGQSVLVFWGIVQAPIVASMSFMGLVAVMGCELSREAIRAPQLDRKLQVSEAALHENEERMRLAVEGANFGIWIRDLARNEIWATDNWRTLFGFSRMERLEFDHILDRLHTNDRDVLRSALGKAALGDGSYEAEYRVVLPNGQMRWISSHGRVEFDGTGKPRLVRGVSHDITERKEAEQETQNLRQEIAHMDRVSMLGQLASALAHEINQPLGAILRNAEAAELFMQNESPDLDEVRAILADIRKDDQRAGSIIERMRGLMKRRDLDKRSVHLAELLGDVVSLVRADAMMRHIKLEVAVANDLPPVHGDRVHLQQVLLNLIVNGMDALDETNGDDRRVSITALLCGPQTVEVAVCDSGGGIPADKLTHIFDSFFTTKPKGMGLGLAISRSIIEAHGGRLWAENKNQGGASFRFTVPTTEEYATQ
jgi:PAS domain S-box-containing protein